MNSEWPEPEYIVPNILPVGLTILAGAPKIGKSWLTLQIAHAVATGGHTFGTQVEQGLVLYLALEDNPTRLDQRMTRQGWPKTIDPSQVNFMLYGHFAQQIGKLLEFIG